MNIRNNLTEEFESELKELKKLKVGSDDYKIAVDGISKLADRIIEIDKFEAEKEETVKDQNNKDRETELKFSQLEADKKDRLIRNCIEGGKIVAGFGLAVWAFIASMNFEKEGTLTTEDGRSALRSLLKFKF